MLTNHLRLRCRKPNETMDFHKAYSYYKSLVESHHAKNPASAAIVENLHPHLTGDVLSGSQRIEFRSPTLFMIDDEFLREFKDLEPEDSQARNNTSYTFFRLGSHLLGHSNIVHGGLLATLLDELTCRLGFQNYQLKRAVTANLNINYLQPCVTDLCVMIKCTVLSKTGRKCLVRGEVFKVDNKAMLVEMNENLLTTCECLIIEPKSWS